MYLHYVKYNFIVNIWMNYVDFFKISSKSTKTIYLSDAKYNVTD